MNTENRILNKVKTLLGIEVKLEQLKLDNGAVIEADAFEVGAEVFVVAENELVALPIGEYTTEDGVMMVISEEGIIGEIKEAGAEEEAPAEEAPVEEEELATEKTNPKKIVKSISEEMFFSEIEKLRDEIKGLKLSKVEKVVELSKADEVEGISHNPENLTEKKQLNLYAQRAKNTIQNRVYNTINK